MVILNTPGDTIRAEASAGSAITVTCYGLETYQGVETYKKLGQTQLTGSGTQDTIYTVPASTSTMCTLIVIANTDSSSRTFSVWHVPNGGSPTNSNVLFKSTDMISNSTVVWNKGNINYYPITGQSGYSGYSGISGYSGFSGKSGYSGFSGYSGLDGSASFSGYSGYSGKSGYSGFSGISGYSGYSGKSGYSGYSGISGYSGFSGKSGYSGTSGYSGNKYKSYSSSDGVTAGNNTTYTSKLNASFTAPNAGNYTIWFSADLTGDNTTAARGVYLQVVLDTATTIFGEYNFTARVAGSYISFAGVYQGNFTAAAHTVDIQYRCTNAADTVSIKNARVFVQEV